MANAFIRLARLALLGAALVTGLFVGDSQRIAEASPGNIPIAWQLAGRPDFFACVVGVPIDPGAAAINNDALRMGQRLAELGHNKTPACFTTTPWRSRWRVPAGKADFSLTVQVTETNPEPAGGALGAPGDISLAEVSITLEPVGPGTPVSADCTSTSVSGTGYDAVLTASFSGKSTYLEPGWPEPLGNYEFTVYVEDRNEPGTGTDGFWIQLRDKDRALVPPLTLAEPAKDNAVRLTGGNIVVPHTKTR